MLEAKKVLIINIMSLNDLTQLYNVLIISDQKKTVQFKDNFNSDTLIITKMGRTLLPKFPRDQDERLWKYIRVLLLGANDDSDIDDPLLIRPPSLATTTASNTSQASAPVSLASMALNGGAQLSVNGNGAMATAGLIGPRHIDNKNTTLTLVPNSGKNKVILKNLL